MVLNTFNASLQVSFSERTKYAKGINVAKHSLSRFGNVWRVCGRSDPTRVLSF